MAQIECWLCEGRGAGQIVLRPAGTPDGRRICRVCARRFFASIRRMSVEERTCFAARLWRRGALPPPLSMEPWREELRAAFAAQVRATLDGEDDLGRAQVALGYFGMELVPEGLEALVGIDPAAFESGALPLRLVTSLMSRMLDDASLLDGARELVRSSLYPGA